MKKTPDNKPAFYAAFDKKKGPSKRGKFVADDDMVEFEDDYYRKERTREKQRTALATSNVEKSTTEKTSATGKTPNTAPKEFPRKTTVQAEAKHAFSKSKDYVHPAFMQYKTEPKCGAFGKCGGCQLQNLTYEGQIKYKQKKIEGILGIYGKVAPIVGMENPEHYRNKVHATFSYDKKGKVIAGIYEEDSHRVIPVTNCLIQDERANGIIKSILKLMPSFKMTPYDEDYDTGFMRHVLIRTSHTTGEVMVVIVGGNPIFPSKNNFVKALVKEHPYITTVVFNVNNRRTSMVLGSQEHVLYGKGYIEDTLCGTTFRISPKSFYQVNSVQAEKMFNKVMQLANLKGTENVLDAYCGIGTIGLIAAPKAGEVIGIELNKDAVRDAIANAKRNNIENIQFFQGDAGEFMVQLAQEEDQTLDLVFMDPPRSGSDEAFLSSLLKLSPKTVLYISCGPESLARDLKVLTNNGYKVKEMIPFDMFPWTEHVEAIILMTKCGYNTKK